MEEEEREKSRYYQAIARLYFLWRGGPFLLSARDLETIAKWEEMGFPLPVVLEGIERFYEKWRRRRPRSKLPPLAFSHEEVLRAFRQYQERLVGQRRKAIPHDKYQQVQEAAANFLKSLPSSWSSLQLIFHEASKVLNESDVQLKERKLEELEEEVDRQLRLLATEEEKREVEQWVEKEFGKPPEKEKQELVSIALLKYMRQKYKVPHLLTCYY